MIFNIHNMTGAQVTLVAATSTEVLAAVTDRPRTVAVVVSALTFFKTGAAASATSFPVPANAMALIAVPAGANLRAFSAGTPTVNVHEVKGSS